MFRTSCLGSAFYSCIRSITETGWGDTTGRLVQPLLRRALEMRGQIARNGWWNSTPAAVDSAARTVVR